MNKLDSDKIQQILSQICFKRGIHITFIPSNKLEFVIYISPKSTYNGVGNGKTLIHSSIEEIVELRPIEILDYLHPTEWDTEIAPKINSREELRKFLESVLLELIVNSVKKELKDVYTQQLNDVLQFRECIIDSLSELENSL